MSGSSIPHDHAFIMRISEAYPVFEDCGTRRHFEGRRLVEVFITADQLVGMLASLNFGGGVPCTLHAVSGQTIPQRTEPEFKALDKVVEAGDNSLEEVRMRLREFRDTALKHAGTKKAQAEIDLAFRVLFDRAESNMKFLQRVLREEADKVKREIVVEAESALIDMVKRAGLEALRTSMNPAALEEPINE